MNKRILLSILSLAAFATNASGMQLVRSAASAPGRAANWATDTANQQFDNVVGAGRTAEEVQEEHLRLCSRIAAIMTTLETTQNLADDFDVNNQIEEIMQRAHDAVPENHSREDIQEAITEILAETDAVDLRGLEISLTRLQSQHLQELQELGADIKLGKLTYREAVKKASPYVKTALKWLIYTSIFVGLCNIVLPETISNPISYSYWYMLGLPVSMAWWAIKLPFRPIFWLLQTYDLQNKLNEASLKPCLDKCMETFKEYLKINPRKLSDLQKYCTDGCTKP